MAMMIDWIIFILLVNEFNGILQILFICKMQIKKSNEILHILIQII